MGFEVKYSGAPKLTKSMQIAMSDLKLDSIKVIYPGDMNYSLREDIEVIGFENYLNLNSITNN